MKVYCQKCGSKIEFSANDKPKFCHSCGASLSLGSNITNAEEDGVNEEAENVTSVPTISGLEVEIHSDPVKGEPLSSLLGTAEEGAPPMNINRPKQTKEEVLENFQKEAGSLKRKKTAKKTPKKT